MHSSGDSNCNGAFNQDLPFAPWRAGQPAAIPARQIGCSREANAPVTHLDRGALEKHLVSASSRGIGFGPDFRNNIFCILKFVDSQQQAMQIRRTAVLQTVLPQTNWDIMFCIISRQISNMQVNSTNMQLEKKTEGAIERATSQHQSEMVQELHRIGSGRLYKHVTCVMKVLHIRYGHVLTRVTEGGNRVRKSSPSALMLTAESRHQYDRVVQKRNR